jgi:hypothetical protein
MVAVAGGSTAFCSSGGIIFWTLLLTLAVPAEGLIHEPGSVLWPLAGYLPVVFVLARYTWLRPTVLMFTLAVVMAYALSVGVADASGWTGGA